MLLRAAANSPVTEVTSPWLITWGRSGQGSVRGAGPADGIALGLLGGNLLA